ncbi:MAG: hypothetical protein WAM95_11640 [Bacillus sp. (in: firmicutes)]
MVVFELLGFIFALVAIGFAFEAQSKIKKLEKRVQIWRKIQIQIKTNTYGYY